MRVELGSEGEGAYYCETKEGAVQIFCPIGKWRLGQLAPMQAPSYNQHCMCA